MADYGEDVRQLKANIIECLTKIETSLTSFGDEIHGKDLIMVLGNTRSGKSTLVNYLLGTPLMGVQSGRMEFRIKKKGESNGPSIGQGSLSHTTIPQVYRVPGQENMAFVDPPGFEDNRGVVQDILNALCINQIKYARSIKFVLVSDIVDITADCIRNFTSSLQHIQNLISNFDCLQRSFCLILTKDWNNHTHEEIVTILTNKILNVDINMDKILVTKFTQNKDSIGLFRQPDTAGDISSALDYYASNAISKSTYIDVEKCEVKFALSEKALAVLFEIYPEYTDTAFFNQQLHSLITNHIAYFEVDRYVFASFDEELQTTKNALEVISSNLSTQIQQYQNLSHVMESLDFLLADTLSPEFRTNFLFVMMLDKSEILEMTYTNMIITNYINSLQELRSKVDYVLSKIGHEERDRRTNKIIFTVSGVGFVAGLGPVWAGASRYVDCMVRTGSSIRNITAPGASCYTACEGAIGAGATYGLCVAGAGGVGAGVGTAYVLYKQTYGRRIEERQAQGRV